MRNTKAHPKAIKKRQALILMFALVLASAIVAAPVYSARIGLFSRDAMKQGSGNSTAIVRTAALATKSSPSASFFSLRGSEPLTETIATFAADCTTPRSAFFLGETVCAKTDNVTLPPADNWWVNWILTGTSPTVVYGGDGVTNVTTNPQTFTYTPTSLGAYKVSLTNLPNDISQTPAGFTVVAAPTLATYASGCASAKTDFNLGETVCIKVSGLSNGEFPNRRVQLAEPDGFVLQRFNVTDNSQQFTYTIPAATTEVFGGETIDHRGTWVVALIDPDADLRIAAPMVVHKSNLFVDRVADLQVAKFLIDTGDPPTAGTDVSFEIFITNQGPDPATTVTLNDNTLPNTTFVSFSRNSLLLGLNRIPDTGGSSFDDMLLNPGLVRFVRDPGFTFFVDDAPAVFNCTSPSAGSAGTTTCTADREIAPGETASFTAVYHISSSLPNGADLSDGNSATIQSATLDPRTASNSSTIEVGSSNSNPPTCALTCPGNMTVTADTTGTDFNGDTVAGANVSFDATTSGTCGTISSTPASGSFFPLGTTPVTISSSDGASCDFLVTVVSSGGTLSISCPANVTANAGPNCDATVNLGTPTTTGDNVTVSSTRNDGRPLSAPFQVGVTTVTWSATNTSGTQSCTQKVTVYDVTPPTITATDSTASADANCQAAVPDYSNAAFDNCACASSDTSQVCDSRLDIKVTQDVAPGTLVGLGPHTIHLAANDGSITPGPDGIIGTPDDIQGNVSLKTITFTVVDTTPPSITAPGPVTAYTGVGATTCDTVVSDAALGTPTTSDNCGPITVTRVPSGNTFAVGTTTVVWTATDGAGNHTSANQTVTVIDNTPPVITTNGVTPSMWPPDHTLKTFRVTDFVTSVFDNCGGVSVGNVVISQVTSDELDDATGGGDGNTTNDIQIAADCKSVQLRSERAGTGDGRVYTITFRLTDTHGNVTTATATVVVPHDQGNGPETVINSGVHYTVNGSCP